MKRLFPSLPQPPHLGDTLSRFPATAGTIMRLADEILLRASDLTTGERELIAAYVSGLNACNFCQGAHRVAAEAFGVDGDLVEALLEDPETAPVAPALKPVLAYVACLTRTPSRVTEAMAQAVYDAGWSEQALYDAIETCAMFCFMNRIVEGTGVSFDFAAVPEMTEEQKAARRARSYSDWGRQIGLV